MVKNSTKLKQYLVRNPTFILTAFKQPQNYFQKGTTTSHDTLSLEVKVKDGLVLEN